MDPITAIGLASVILTFVDFAHKIVTGADELHRNAITEENTHTENIVEDLDDATINLVDLPGKTKHEEALNNLAGKFRDVSGELHRLLKKLTIAGDRTTWRVLKVAVRNIRKEGEVSKLVTRLDKYRGEILLRLNLMLK